MRLCPWSLALASSVPVLGLERFCPRKGCPWPWPRIFFCVLGLGLEPCVLKSTSGPNHQKHARNRLRYLRKVEIILTQRKTDEIKKITSVTAKIFCVNTLTLDVTATER